MQKTNPKKAVYKKQSQHRPGLESKMDPLPEFTYASPGGNRLLNKKCIVTGGDSGIGRAVAVTFAKQGADVAILYLKQEEKDAQETADIIETVFKRQCLLLPTDVSVAAVHYPKAEITMITTKTIDRNFLAVYGTQTPMKRAGQPAEVASAYLFLASDDASYITGQVIHVNGGEIING